MKFRKKPVVVEAVQLRQENWSAILELARTSLRGDGLRRLSEQAVAELYPYEVDVVSGALYAQVYTLNGAVLATEGDWIIRGTNSELWPCKPDIFEYTYEPVEGGE